MRNYTINKVGESNFITDFYKAQDGTYTIEFADGSLFKRVIACDENLEKLNEIQQKQIEDGVRNYPKLKRNASKQGIMTAFNFAGTAGVLFAVTLIPGIKDFVAQQGGLFTGCTIGILSVLANIPSFAKFSEKINIVGELDKIKFVNKYREVLYSFREHSNSLANLNPDVVDFIYSQEDPFTVENLERISLSDLRQIVSNISKEEKLGLTYKKVIRRPSNHKKSK